MPARFAKNILNWFDQHGRKHLPWQQNISAYRVWISEIMLQQTQVTTVIPYFERFMRSFPTVESLAAAPLDEVLHHWSGLGYYTRAKNLHKAANMVVDDFAGEFPNSVEQLCQLPGIGRSTAGAIIAIAFQRRAVILDGNVKRVLTRHEAIAGWPGKTTVHDELWLVAERLTPTQRVADYTQAMMDLGATLCTRSQPRCTECPIQKSCRAFNEQRIKEFPGKKPKKILPVKSTRMLVISHKQDILLQQRPLSGIWPGLWSFIEISPADDIDDYCQQHLRLKKYQRQSLEGFRHTFSHYHLDISIEHIEIPTKLAQIMEDRQQLWYNKQQPQSIGLAAPVTRILKML
jgi:A/G-specific adenine glycosylase